MMAGILFVGLVAYPLLPVAPLPQVDFPTIQITATLPGAQPGNHGVVGGAAAGAAVRADSRHRPDDLDELSGNGRGHDPVRSQPQHRRRRQRRPGRASTPPAASCRRTSPRRRPTARSIRRTRRSCCCRRHRTRLPLTTVSDAVDAQLAQQISQISGVAQVTIGGQQKPSIRVQVDPAKLVAKGLSLEDVRNQIAITTVDSPKGNIDGDNARLHDLRQRPDAGLRRTGTTSSSPTAMAARCGSATSARR